MQFGMDLTIYVASIQNGLAKQQSDFIIKALNLLGLLMLLLILVLKLQIKQLASMATL